MKHLLPVLAYGYDALEPFIDTMTMTIHHTKHHQAYVDNLNAALDKHPEIANLPLEKLLLDLENIPADIQTAVKNNGGGHWNHAFFWSLLKINRGRQPEGALKAAIDETFGSYDAFKDAFATAAKTRFGSGWVWLLIDEKKRLNVVSTPNQDPVFALGAPIVGLDVWEHAYYLKYQNRRPEYVNAFFSVIDWTVVERLYAEAVR
ncbi:MAG: superoxide dismutase [Bacillota bacterium]|nr:superoxide dismutase [Bacillota bacterium]